MKFHERVEQKAKHAVGVHYIPVTIECDLGNDLPGLAGDGPQAKPSRFIPCCNMAVSHCDLQGGQNCLNYTHTQRCLREVLPMAGESAGTLFGSWRFQASHLPWVTGTLTSESPCAPSLASVVTAVTLVQNHTPSSKAWLSCSFSPASTSLPDI